jgi:hypothetical protein
MIILLYLLINEINRGKNNFLKGFMFGTKDDFFLKIFSQVIEVIAVPRNTDNQVAVIFRMFFGIPEHVGIYDIELDVMPVHPEIAPDQ